MNYSDEFANKFLNKYRSLIYLSLMHRRVDVRSRKQTITSEINYFKHISQQPYGNNNQDIC